MRVLVAVLSVMLLPLNGVAQQDAVKVEKKPAPRPLVSGFIVMPTYTYHDYSEQYHAQFVMHAIGIRGGYTTELTPLYNFTLNASGTITGLLQNVANTDVRFFGINARFGYRVPSIREPWNLSLGFGGYYSTMSVSSGLFGYQHLIGPQIYPALRYKIDRDHAFATFAKFSPVSGKGVKLLSLENREIAVGMILSRQLEGGGNLSLTTTLTELQLSIKGILVESTSFSLGLGYGW